MNEHRTFTQEEKTQISERISQSFAFLRDVLNDPAILEEIPSGSTLLFRDVVIGSITFHLVAHPDDEHEGRWIARITAPAAFAAEPRNWSPPATLHGRGGKWSSPATHPESGDSAEHALDALAEKLHDSRRHFVDALPTSRQTA